MKFILSLILIVSTILATPVYGIIPVDSAEFEGVYNDPNCELKPLNVVECLSGNWYLDYIGMNYIYNQGINLYPDFTVAVLDTLIDTRHEDILDFIIRDISLEGYGKLLYPFNSGYALHGNMVTSLFSAGIIGNNIGGRGIVNTNTLFLSALSKSDQVDELGNTVSIGYNMKTVLEGLDRLLNPSTQSIIAGFTRPRIVNLSFGMSPFSEFGFRRNAFNQGFHFATIQKIREYIKLNSDVLFVLTSANESTDAKKSNGAIHYQYVGQVDNSAEMLDENNYVLNKLSNLIIVSANGPDGVLHGYSSYGESVDISGPSGVYTSSCVKDVPYESTYLSTTFGSEWYGYSFYTVDNSDNEDKLPSYLLNPELPDFTLYCNHMGYADGVSTPTPIVSGAAAILLSNDETLSPSDIKAYLTQSPNLQKTALRYSDDANSHNGYGHLCPGLAYIESCTIQTPILNIETSMKQYEVQNSVILPPLFFDLSEDNLYGELFLTSTDYYHYNTSTKHNSPLNSESLKIEISEEQDIFFINTEIKHVRFCDRVDGHLQCSFDFGFKYYADTDITVTIYDSYLNSVVGVYNLQKDSIDNFSVSLILEEGGRTPTGIFFIYLESAVNGNLYIDDLFISNQLEDFVDPSQF